MKQEWIDAVIQGRVDDVMREEILSWTWQEVREDVPPSKHRLFQGEPQWVPYFYELAKAGHAMCGAHGVPLWEEAGDAHEWYAFDVDAVDREIFFVSLQCVKSVEVYVEPNFVWGVTTEFNGTI